MDSSSKKLKIRVRMKNEPSFSQDNSTVQSNRSRSRENADSEAVNANTENTEFVNHAVILWNEMRQQWVANRPAKKAKRVAEPVLRSNTSYESLHSLSQRIPLPEMIEFLVNEWKKEGIYGEPEQAYT